MKSPRISYYTSLYISNCVYNWSSAFHISHTITIDIYTSPIYLYRHSQSVISTQHLTIISSLAIRYPHSLYPSSSISISPISHRISLHLLLNISRCISQGAMYIHRKLHVYVHLYLHVWVFAYRGIRGKYKQRYIYTTVDKHVLIYTNLYILMNILTYTNIYTNV